jgi:hypothetical protein
VSAQLTKTVFSTSPHALCGRETCGTGRKTEWTSKEPKQISLTEIVIMKSTPFSKKNKVGTPMKQRFDLHIQHMRAKPKLSRVPMSFYTRKVGLVNKKRTFGGIVVRSIAF